MSVVKQIYKLRRDFILIGLTGKTGSGCTTVAELLSGSFSNLKTEYKEINDGCWDNNSRKNKIVYQYMQQHWHCFTTIKASDIIFFYALLHDYDTFKQEISSIREGGIKLDKEGKKVVSKDIEEAVESIKLDFLELQKEVKECNEYIEKKSNVIENDKVDLCIEVVTRKIAKFRQSLSECIKATKHEVLATLLQTWGDNIRMYDSIIEPVEKTDISEKAPACLASKINKIIKVIRARNTVEEKYTNIVIDALRNPYEVLYFRERYSAFYLMSVNTTEDIRRKKLFEKGYSVEDVEKIDKREEGQKDFTEAYMKIDIVKCIELSDIHLAHDGLDYRRNRKLANQIITYLSLIRHPGLVPPSPIERCMQIAFTAKLNSGCLSRQVGAVVTNDKYSVQSIGWNTVAQGQTPCSLRDLRNLYQLEDENAYSNYERSNKQFRGAVEKLNTLYCKCCDQGDNVGLPMAYCFKDIHNSIDKKQAYNQVHTRSLHAEENAFLQLSKYGTSGIEGGYLFTTSSCCELCGKKAYQLGIKKIYYIDGYPGITKSHIIESGSNQPKMELFHGAIGRAYINLYNPLLPLKDEIEALTSVNVKEVCKSDDSNNELKGAKA